MTLVRIAFRNVLKNRRRSLITVLAIGIGFAAVGVFKGYTHDAYQRIAAGAIFVEIPGHIVIFKKGFLDQGRIDPSKFLFSADEISRVTSIVKQHAAPVWVAPKLAISGLITNGSASTIFMADAMDPLDARALWKFYPYGNEFKHKFIPMQPLNACLLAPKLARLMQLKSGDDAVLMATTQAGQMNAVDIHVADTDRTISDAIEDKYLSMPLSLARSLYDFPGADRICVLFSAADLANKFQPIITQRLQEAGFTTEVKRWDQLSVFYQKVREYLDTIFFFIFSIVSVIVITSTFNTMSMAVYERTREIGTLRAIGLKQIGVIHLFALEGAILGTFGVALGVTLTILTHILLTIIRPTYIPPGTADNVAIQVSLVPTVFVTTAVCFVALSIVSAVLPARRSARQGIVDSLGHV